MQKHCSLCLNVDSVADDVTSDLRLFQVFAAVTQSARSPTVQRCVCHTARSADDANVVDREDRRNAVDCQSDMSVWDPSGTETASTASLNDIRSGTRSQCRWWSSDIAWTDYGSVMSSAPCNSSTHGVFDSLSKHCLQNGPMFYLVQKFGQGLKPHCKNTLRSFEGHLKAITQ